MCVCVVLTWTPVSGAHRWAVGSGHPSLHGAVCHLLPGQAGSPLGHQLPSAPLEQDHRGDWPNTPLEYNKVLKKIWQLLKWTKSSSSLLPLVLQDPGRSAGFHPSGAVLAVGTMTGRSVNSVKHRLYKMTTNVYFKSSNHVNALSFKDLPLSLLYKV